MESIQTRPRSMALPAGALRALHRAVRSEAGPLAAAHALQAGGYETAESFWDDLERALGREPDSLGEAAFFRMLSEFLQGRGWGSLKHSTPHAAVGLLASGDWAEAGEAGEETQPTCAFSAGLLAGLLSRAAGGPVAVLQVGCRSRGDGECAFAFGSEATIHDLYGLLLDGRSLAAALAEL